MISRVLAVGLVMAVLSWFPTAEAYALDSPQGRVVLTVRGNIENTNSKIGAQFDLSMLDKLPQKTIKTSTRWTSGVQVFEGVPVVELLRHLGAGGDKIEAIALDGYVTPLLKMDDLRKYGVILATKKNGEYLKVREKGPIWMIYPVDDFPELKNDLTTQYKLIWHLRTLVVK